METKFNFNSQVCTSKIQSERLLALGLKKETADMYWWQETNEYQELNGRWHCQLISKYTKEHFDYLDKTFGVDLVGDIDDGVFLPAWSLHRLLCLYNCHYLEFMGEEEIASAYDVVIEAIESAITGGYFNEKYLE